MKKLNEKILLSIIKDTIRSLEIMSEELASPGATAAILGLCKKNTERILQLYSDEIKLLPGRKHPKPQLGQKIYVGSQYYIDREEDDFDGGLCTIIEINNEINNCRFVSVKERPISSMNYDYLMDNQERWKKEYGRRRGRMSNA